MNRFWILKNSDAEPCFSPCFRAFNLITQADDLYRDMTRTGRFSGNPAPLRGRNQIGAILDDPSFSEAADPVFINCTYSTALNWNSENLENL